MDRTVDVRVISIGLNGRRHCRELRWQLVVQLGGLERVVWCVGKIFAGRVLEAASDYIYIGGLPVS